MLTAPEENHRHVPGADESGERRRDERDGRAKVVAKRGQLFDAVFVARPMARCRGELGEHRAPRSLVLSGTQHGQHELMRGHPGPPWGLDDRHLARGHLEQSGHQVDPGPPSVAGLDEARVDVDVDRAIARDNGVG